MTDIGNYCYTPPMFSNRFLSILVCVPLTFGCSKQDEPTVVNEAGAVSSLKTELDGVWKNKCESEKSYSDIVSYSFSANSFTRKIEFFSDPDCLQPTAILQGTGTFELGTASYQDDATGKSILTFTNGTSDKYNGIQMTYAESTLTYQAVGNEFPDSMAKECGYTAEIGKVLDTSTCSAINFFMGIKGEIEIRKYEIETRNDGRIQLDVSDLTGDFIKQ